MDLDKRGAEVIEIIGNLCLKIFLGVVAAVILCVLLYFMIVEPKWENKLLYAGVDTLFGICIIKVFAHYFPSKK